MDGAAVSLEDVVIDGKIQDLWEGVVAVVNKVTKHADVYGFELMTIPDPDVHKLTRALDMVVVPYLDELVRTVEFSPESGIKMANIRQYTLHLREITIALDEKDQVLFDKTIELLVNSPMLV